MILRKWLNFIKIYRHPIVLIPDLFVLKSLRLKFNLGANLGWSPVTSTQKAPGTNLRTLFFALEQWPHPFLNLMILSKNFAKQGKIGNYLLTRV